jgi:DNA-binding response OmpR family regulator
VPRILIVEDERLLLKTLADALREKGYRIETAVSAAEAETQLFPRGDFDLVVLDIRLPDRSGIEVLQRMRSAGQGTRVVAMTAFGSNGLTQELQRLKVDIFLKKPFDLSRMLESVADLVGASES